MPAPRPAPGTRADYQTFADATTRWMDNDVFGHLNNVVYYSLFDSAVCRRLIEAGILQQPGAAHILVVAESGCRFHAEVRYPEALHTGLRLAHLGGSSIRHEVAVFRAGGDTACAEGFMVHVCVDAATRRPSPMPQAWRDALQQQKD